MASSIIIVNQNEIRDNRGRIVLGTIAKLNDERFCYVCTQCDGEFLSIQTYQQHIYLVHQKQIQAEEVMPTDGTVNVRYGQFSTPATQQPTEAIIILSDSEDSDDDEIFFISSGDESKNDDDRMANLVCPLQKSIKREPNFKITENIPAKVQFTVQKALVKREPMEIPEMINDDEPAKKMKLDYERPMSSSTSNEHKPAAIAKIKIDDYKLARSKMPPATNGNNSNDSSNKQPMRSIDDDFDFEWSGSEVDLSEATGFGVSDESENDEENNDHDKTIQADDTGSKCSWCPQTFGKIFDLNRHLVTCDGWLKQFLICNHCPNKKFKWNTTKGIHMKKIHSNPNRQFNCKSCTRSFSTYYQLYQHGEHMHTERPAIECYFCKDKKFLSWYERNQHVLKKHQFGEYECSKLNCGYTCKTADQLLQHHNTIHSGQRPGSNDEFR